MPFFSQSIKEYKIVAEKYEALLKKALDKYHNRSAKLLLEEAFVEMRL